MSRVRQHKSRKRTGPKSAGRKKSRKCARRKGSRYRSTEVATPPSKLTGGALIAAENTSPMANLVNTLQKCIPGINCTGEKPITATEATPVEHEELFTSEDDRIAANSPPVSPVPFPALTPSTASPNASAEAYRASLENKIRSDPSVVVENLLKLSQSPKAPENVNDLLTEARTHIQAYNENKDTRNMFKNSRAEDALKELMKLQMEYDKGRNRNSWQSVRKPRIGNRDSSPRVISQTPTGVTVLNSSTTSGRTPQGPRSNTMPEGVKSYQSFRYTGNSPTSWSTGEPLVPWVKPRKSDPKGRRTVALKKTVAHDAAERQQFNLEKVNPTVKAVVELMKTAYETTLTFRNITVDVIIAYVDPEVGYVALTTATGAPEHAEGILQFSVRRIDRMKKYDDKYVCRVKSLGDNKLYVVHTKHVSTQLK